MKKALFITGFAFACLIFCPPVSAQDEEPPSRSITSTDFQNKRQTTQEVNVKLRVDKIPESKNAAKKIKLITNPKRRYNLTKRFPTKKTRPKIARIVTKTEELGVTFWRMRPLTGEDEDALTLPVKIGNKTENCTAERVSSATEFINGDRLRFTIEPSVSGYLYIINREMYSDGTSGAASIIFPTLRNRSGNNRVQAGSLIEIPAAEDTIPYFTVKSKRADFRGEELIVLILRDELPGFKVGVRAQTLADEILNKWFEDWESPLDVFDAEDGSGIAYTQTEANIAKVPTRALSQEEPLPQTIYRVTMRESNPLFVTIQMRTSPQK